MSIDISWYEHSFTKTLRQQTGGTEKEALTLHQCQQPPHPQSLFLNQVYGLPRWLSGKECTCNAENAGSILGLGRSPGKGMATHSSILAWRIPWTEDPSGLQSIGSQRVGHVLSDCTHTFAATWMGLETIILSGVSQTQKSKYIISLICGINKNCTKEIIDETEIESQMWKTNI